MSQGLQVIEMMEASDLSPNVITFNAILKAVEKAGESGEVTPHNIIFMGRFIPVISSSLGCSSR